MDFDMVCPKCGTNRWKLRCVGTTSEKTTDVTTKIGDYGNVVIMCRKCKFEHRIGIGSD